MHRRLALLESGDVALGWRWWHPMGTSAFRVLLTARFLVHGNELWGGVFCGAWWDEGQEKKAANGLIAQTRHTGIGVAASAIRLDWA
jgi:hypothetical protein